MIVQVAIIEELLIRSDSVMLELDDKTVPLAGRIG